MGAEQTLSAKPVPADSASFWQLPQRVLRHLSVSKKLTLICVLCVASVGLLTALMLSEMRRSISLAQTERQGAEYLRLTIDSLVTAAFEGAGAARQTNRHHAADQVRQVEREFSFGNETKALAEAFADRLQTQPEPLRSKQPQPEMLAAGRALTAEVGNASRLVLDPELDSYYAMSVALFRFPDLMQGVSELGAHLRQWHLAGATPSTQLQVKHLVLQGKLDAFMAQMRQDHKQMVASAGEDNRKTQTAALARLENALAPYWQLTASMGATAPNLTQMEKLETLETEMLLETSAAWISTADHLIKLLDQRHDQLWNRRALLVGTAMLILGVLLGMGLAVAKSIVGPLKQLAGMAEEVALTGDYSVRVNWKSEDEIGRLVLCFNNMLHGLSLIEKRHRNLASAARAAEAQRNLVEQIPLPVIVTSSTHKVLHANVPAAEWLRDDTENPWKANLEDDVRERFLQQIAEDGRVDEYEVRWSHSHEVNWAVLSACRISFQGEDALLTVIAPINRLKKLERRLRLWSAVFEACSEGVAILDSQRRIVITNEAMSRSTLHAMGDIVGESAEHMFQAAPPALWEAVDNGQSWRGELEVRRRDHTTYPAWAIATGVLDDLDEAAHYILITIDITDRKQSESRMRFLAEHDFLTGLPNRTVTAGQLRMSLQRAAPEQQKVAVLFLDLDRFKDINDSLGHHTGDRLLRSVSNRLLAGVRAGDTVGRTGGNEFLLVLQDVSHIDKVTDLVKERLVSSIRTPHQVDDAELHVSCSIGIALYPDHGQDADELIKKADAALYQAKADGKDVIRFYSAGMTERARSRVELDAMLRRALELGQLELHYQPRVDARTGSILGAEALIRWSHPQLGLVPPAHFIPLAEDTGLIIPIGEWVIQQACRQIQTWHAEGLGPINVSVNISARQLRDERLVDVVRDALLNHKVVPDSLELELTESLVMDNAERTLRQMHALRGLGVPLSIDDFGTGFSSLAYLNRFPINKLKIDRTFIRDVLTSATNGAITRAVINLGHTIGLNVVAEGVETLEVAQALRQQGCDELQGYFFGRPVPAASFAKQLSRREIHTETVGH